jgi:hypothetical protein
LPATWAADLEEAQRWVDEEREAGHFATYSHRNAATGDYSIGRDEVIAAAVARLDLFPLFPFTAADAAGAPPTPDAAPGPAAPQESPWLASVAIATPDSPRPRARVVESSQGIVEGATATAQDWRDLRAEFEKLKSGLRVDLPIVRADYAPPGWGPPVHRRPAQHWVLSGGDEAARRRFEILAAAAAALLFSPSDGGLEQWLDVLRDAGIGIRSEVTITSPEATWPVSSIEDVCEASIAACTLLATRTLKVSAAAPVGEMPVGASAERGAPDAWPHEPLGTSISTWADLGLRFLSDEALQVVLNGKIQAKQNYAELGFEDRRTKKPTLAWETLLEIARHDGRLKVDRSQSGYPKQAKRVEEIRRNLRHAFPCAEDPLPLVEDEYRAQFQVIRTSAFEGRET